MKRSFSDSDSDEEKFFERDEKDSDGPDARARKRRRGQIEKKRRDRINSSLAELRQLVPAALQKQGSAKLEKAEILQLTVEHLRRLKYGGEYVTGLHSTKRALNECITARQECLAATVSTETAHGRQLSTARRQIVNHLSCSAASLSGHNAINPPTTTLVTSTKNTDQELLSPGYIFAPFSPNARDLSKGTEATRLHTIQDWGLSVAVNPLMLPAQTSGFANVLHPPFNQGVPRIDWSMALIAKTNFITPFPARWAP